MPLTRRRAVAAALLLALFGVVVSRARSSAEHRPPERARPQCRALRARSRPRRHRRHLLREDGAAVAGRLRRGPGGRYPNYDVEAGATVTLKAEPDLDSKPDPPDPQRGGERSFVRWSDEDCWTTNPCEFVMPNEPVSMVAIFSPAEVEISIASNNGGRITGPAPPAASRLTATTRRDVLRLVPGRDADQARGEERQLQGLAPVVRGQREDLQCS